MFTSYDTKEFTLQNFTAAWELFTTAKDANLSLALLNTTKFFLVSFFTIPIPIITAYVLYKKVFLNNFIRIVLYLPGAISGIMMARLFNQFVQSQGILGGILEAFGLPMKSASLFTDESTALGTIMFFDVWMGLGGSLILWLGAVNRIPTELVEYNKLLGLGELKEFVLVVLPAHMADVRHHGDAQPHRLFRRDGLRPRIHTGQRGHYDNFLLDVPHFAESGRIDVPYFQRGGTHHDVDYGSRSVCGAVHYE